MLSTGNFSELNVSGDAYIGGDLQVDQSIVFAQQNSENLLVTGISTLFNLEADYAQVNTLSVAGFSSVSFLLADSIQGAELYLYDRLEGPAFQSSYDFYSGISSNTMGDTYFYGEVDFSLADVRGLEGVAGSMGATGPQGPQGFPGDPGGATGATGEAGPMGPAGPQGPAGPAFFGGATGATGLMGPAGPMGSAGATGLVGPQGATGLMGPAGSPGGATGATGVAGPAGAPGAAGFGIRAAATSDKNGIMSYNVGISSCLKDAVQEGKYTYYFDAPIQGGYAVSAQVMFNNSNLHANVMEQTADYVTILVTKSGLGKAQNKDHSIIVVK